MPPSGGDVSADIVNCCLCCSIVGYQFSREIRSAVIPAVTIGILRSDFKARVYGQQLPTALGDCVMYRSVQLKVEGNEERSLDRYQKIQSLEEEKNCA